MSKRMRAVAAALMLSTAALAAGTQPVLTPPEHRRGAEQTYLTFPEWFLVHSPAELADYLRDDRPAAAPSGFPFIRHIGQFWDSYISVSRSASKVGEVNLGYHVMVLVIGISTTVEYALKAAYEGSIGRLTELLRPGPGAEDRVAADVAREYVDFIRVQPWYEFDFLTALRRVWTSGPASDEESVLRRWERRWFLTHEYGVKAAYGWLIKKATKAAYEEPLPVTAIVLDRSPPATVAGAPDLRCLSALSPPNGSLCTIPRYEAFNQHAQALAQQGLNFVEIAGNRGDILVSLWHPTADAIGQLHETPGARPLFEQPLITKPGLHRHVIAVPVGELAEALRLWRGQGLKIEHVYDY